MKELKDVLIGNHVYWIGLSDTTAENNFVWDDGTPTDFTQWNNNEPNDWGSGEDCVHIRKNGGWNDIRCSAKGHYVCQYPV